MIILLGAGLLALSMTAAAPAGVRPDAAFTPVATVPVGQDPTGIAVNERTDTVYVTCTGPSPAVYAINGTTNAVEATIPVGSYPQAAAVNPVTNMIYTDNPHSGTVSVISGATSTVSATVPVPAGSRLGSSGLAVDTKTNAVYVVGPNVVSVISGATNTVTKTISVGTSYAVAVDAATHTVYVPSYREISIINALNNKVTGVISFGRYESQDAAMNPVTDTLFITVRHGLILFSGKTKTVAAKIPLTHHTEDVAVDQRNNTAYVTNRYELWKINATAGKTVGSVQVLAQPVAVDSLTRMVYVGRYGSPEVQVFSTP